jgi:hypothetical protein
MCNAIIYQSDYNITNIIRLISHWTEHRYSASAPINMLALCIMYGNLYSLVSRNRKKVNCKAYPVLAGHNHKEKIERPTFHFHFHDPAVKYYVLRLTCLPDVVLEQLNFFNCGRPGQARLRQTSKRVRQEKSCLKVLNWLYFTWFFSSSNRILCQ